MRTFTNSNFPDQLSSKDLYVPNPAFREKPEEVDVLAYFRTYFNCAYYCLVCPYRFSVDPSTKEYSVVQAGLGGKIIRLLCLSLLLLRVQAAYLFLQRAKENNIDEYTQTCVIFIQIFYIFTLQLIIRRRKNSFLRILELLNKHRHRSFLSSTRNEGSLLERYVGWSNARRMAIGLCAFSFFYQSLSVIQFFVWKLGKFLNSDGELWLEEKSILKTNLGIDESSGLLLPVMVVIYYIFIIYDTISAAMADSLFVLTSATLLHLLRNFLQHLDASSPRQIVEDYKIIIRILNMTNETIGPLVLIFAVGVTPWFAKCVLRVFQPEEGESMYPFMFLVTTSIYLHLGASVNRKMEQLKTWLHLKENNKLIEPSDLVLILHDLSPGTTGLRGMGFFCISHSFIGSMCGAVVSFCIILIQFKSSQKTAVSLQPPQ